MTKLSDTPPARSIPVLVGFEGVTLPDWLARALRRGDVAGVVLFDRNVVDRVQVRSLTAEIHAANPAAVVAVDEEGGSVSRLTSIHGGSPSAAALGAIGDPQLTGRVARWLACQLADLGIDLNLSPVADLARAENSAVGTRSFGKDPEVVGAHVAAWVEGMQHGGVAACVKHFPGHGATSVDSHEEAPVVSDSWEALSRRELVPFRAAIVAGVAAVMPGHITVDTVDSEPATWSSILLRIKLRGELGFSGSIISDALDMGALAGLSPVSAAQRALKAGIDLVCLGGRPAESHDVERLTSELEPRVWRFSKPTGGLGRVADPRSEVLSRLLVPQLRDISPREVRNVHVARPAWSAALDVPDPLPLLVRSLLPDAEMFTLTGSWYSADRCGAGLTLLILRGSAGDPTQQKAANYIAGRNANVVVVETGEPHPDLPAVPTVVTYGDDPFTLKATISALTTPRG